MDCLKCSKHFKSIVFFKNAESSPWRVQLCATNLGSASRVSFENNVKIIIIIFYGKVLLVMYEQKLYKMHICKTPILRRCEITFSKDKSLWH